jgi:hypothetical protein
LSIVELMIALLPSKPKTIETQRNGVNGGRESKEEKIGVIEGHEKS